MSEGRDEAAYAAWMQDVKDWFRNLNDDEWQDVMDAVEAVANDR